MVISYEFGRMWFWAVCRYCPVIRLVIMRKSKQICHISQ